MPGPSLSGYLENKSSISKLNPFEILICWDIPYHTRRLVPQYDFSAVERQRKLKIPFTVLIPMCDVKAYEDARIPFPPHTGDLDLKYLCGNTLGILGETCLRVSAGQSL